MKKEQELTSTERLLNKIKDSSSESPAAPASRPDAVPSGPAPTFRPHQKPAFSSALFPRSARRAPTGIIFGKDVLSIVTPGTGVDGGAYVADIRNMPYPDGVDLFSEGFDDILSRALSGLDPARLSRVWCVLPDNLVDIRYLKLPRTRGDNLANAAFWSYKKEVVADEKDIVFDYEAVDEITERGVAKLGVCAYSVHRDVVTRTREVLEKVGCVVEGITSGAFALQTLVKSRSLRPDIENICCVHVGREASAIHIFSGASLMLVRQIRAGLASLAEAMMSAGEGEEVLHLESEGPGDTAVDQLVRHMREMGDAAGTDADTLFPALGPAVERIGRQVERTIAFFRQNVQPDRISAVLIHGEVAGYRPFVRAIADLLGIPVYTPDDVLASDVRLLHANHLKQEAQFLFGLGLVRASLADTPNILFTAADKRAYKKAAIVNRGVWVVSLLTLAACIGMVSWQGLTLAGLHNEKGRLVQGTDAGAGDLNQGTLSSISAKVENQQKALRARSVKLAPRVVIHEMVTLTPEKIKLSDMTLNLTESRQIDFSGYVMGTNYSQESALAAYVLDLSASPLFEQVRVNRRGKARMGGQDVLEFSATITL